MKFRMPSAAAWLLVLFAFELFAREGFAADKQWIEVRSPHFRILSDGGERQARAVARQCERMRTAFATAMPWLRLDSPTPLLVLAAKDESSARDLAPEMWKRPGPKPGGFFARGWEKAFAVVRLDVVQRQSASGAGDGYQVLYHEYTHYLLNANFPWLPDWVNEGLAEFLGNTQFEDGKIYLGAPNIRAQYTRGQPLLPLEKLMAAALVSPEYRDEAKLQLFYSESWGLFHFLMIPSSMERGRRVQQFLTLLDKGVEQKAAFREAIGDFKEIEEQLKRYLDKGEPEVFVFNNPSELRDDAFSMRPMTPAESNAEVGTFQVWLHENAAARQTLDRALKADPRSALALQAMGFLKLSEGNDQGALGDFDRALKEDPTLYLSAFYRAMLSPSARSDAALNQVLALNREFAPAYVQLAAGYVREKNFERAVNAAVKAQQLGPSRAGYHLLIGNILHAVGRDNEAAAVARYVADRWQGLNHDEAAELWQKLSPGARQGADIAKRPALPGTHMKSGRIASLRCNDKDQTMTVVIDGAPLTFRTNDDKTNIEFSDTLWFGADHFNVCRHLDGLRAEIQYAPSSGSSRISGTLMQFDIYDDVP